MLQFAETVRKPDVRMLSDMKDALVGEESILKMLTTSSLFPTEKRIDSTHSEMRRSDFSCFPSPGFELLRVFVRKGVILRGSRYKKKFFGAF